MPDWAMQILVPAGGLGMLAALVKTWWTGWREDRIRREAVQQAIVDRLQKKNDDQQAKFESLLMDAKAKADEDHALRAERIATDKQMVALATAMTAALERANAINARLLKDGQ